MKKGIRIILPLLFTTLGGLIVMLIWNGVVPSTTHWGNLDYLQAVGLLTLVRIVVGTLLFAIRHPNRANFKSEIKAQIKEMSPEQRREYIKEYMKKQRV